MGVFERGTLQGAIAFHDWNPHAGVIEFSGASISKRWLSRGVLAVMADYVFNQLGCQLVIAKIAADNTPLVRMFRATGFAEALIPRLLGRDRDAILMSLTIETWRASRWHKDS